MIRKIVDYQKLNEELLNLLVEKFPEGYADKDIIAFRNAQNEHIEAVEIRTEDTIYLVKVGKRLVQAMEDFEDDEDNSSNNETESNDEKIDLDALSYDNYEDD
jgi:DNA-directed RNA polymerase subunit delta